MEEWFILTPQQAAAAKAKSLTTLFKVEPRVIDNPLVLQLGDALVASVTLMPRSAVPARVVDDPEYGPVWRDFFAAIPRRSWSAQILFLPSTILGL